MRGDQWYARFRLPDGRTAQKKLGGVWPSNKRGRVPEGFLNERMAQEKLNELLADARRGLLAPPAERAHTGGPTFRDAVEEWLRYVQHHDGVRATTIREYRSAVYKHLVPTFGDDRLQDVTAKRLEMWKAQLLAEGKVSRRTVNKLLTNANGIFKRARKVYGLPTNPVEDVERLKEYYDAGKFDFYSKEEVWALERALRERTRGETYTSEMERELAEYLAEQDAAIVRTLAFAGLRLGEGLGLRWRDIDFANKVIRVSQQLDDMGVIAAPKGKRVRGVPMVPSTAQALATLNQRGHAVGDDDPVFVGMRYARRWAVEVNVVGGDEPAEWDWEAAIVAEPVDRSTFRDRYKAAQERAGLRPLTLHDLRHTFATLAVNYAASGKELQEWLGHAQFRTTERYLHYKERGDAAERLAPAFAVPTTELEIELERAAEEAQQA